MAIFRLKLEKTIVALDFSIFSLSKYNISCKNLSLNVAPKFPYLDNFGLELEKATVLWDFTSTLSNFSKHRIGYFRLEFQGLMSYLKSASSNLLTCKVSSKNKETLNLGPKKPYLAIFGLQFNSNYYQVLNQRPQIMKT